MPPTSLTGAWRVFRLSRTDVQPAAHGNHQGAVSGWMGAPGGHCLSPGHQGVLTGLYPAATGIRLLLPPTEENTQMNTHGYALSHMRSPKPHIRTHTHVDARGIPTSNREIPQHHHTF